METVYLEWSGAALAMIGAVLVAGHSKASLYGWLLWIVSNILWILFSLQMATFGLLAQQAFFLAVNAWGVYRHLKADAKSRTQEVTVC